MEPTTELVLSAKDQKILETPVALYEHIKQMYGIANSERPGNDPSIVKAINISIPGLPRSPEIEPVWSIHLENNTSEENIFPEAKDLIFGVTWPEPKCMWSRIIAVKAGVNLRPEAKSFARCRYKVIANTLFEIEYVDSFTPVAVFLNVMEYFLKQY